MLSASAWVEKHSGNQGPGNNECYSSDGKIFWQSGAKESHRLTLYHSSLQACFRERIPQCNSPALVGGGLSQ